MSRSKQSQEPANAVEKAHAAVQKAVVASAPAELVMSLPAYFSTLGKPAHHMAGMRAHAGKLADRKCTPSQWRKLFASYGGNR